VLVPFHRDVDREVCQEVASRAKAGVKVIAGEMSVEELAGMCAHLDLAVGMRLHFLVFASLAGVPPVAIAYDPKVGQFLGRLGLPTAVPVEGLTPGALQDQVEYVIENSEALREQVARRVEALRKEARLTAELALNLI
jgi:polysaccharide pyruvyl transferase WcaK-like protein